MRRRLIAAASGIVVVGGMSVVATVSSAATGPFGNRQRAGCSESASATPRRGTGGHRHPLPPNATDPALDAVNADPGTPSSGATSAPASGATTSAPASGSDGSRTGNRRPRQPVDPCAPSSGGSGSASGTAAPSESGSGLDILGTDCSNSTLEPHNGFQEAPRCVDTAFGEVAAAAQSPSLLITAAPQRVGVNQRFEIQVSSRNLVRDRFLAAAAGGYYVERSVLDAQGLQRGHVHTACRMLSSTRTAPDPAPPPAFFQATEDGGGGARADQITISVTGLPTPGVAQCAVWAGDGSHRMPMMQRANQTPAFDVVRVTVTP